MTPESENAFARFRDIVATDGGVRDRLVAERDPHAFAALVVRLGAERGFVFDEETVSAAMLAGRRAWLERRI